MEQVGVLPLRLGIEVGEQRPLLGLDLAVVDRRVAEAPRLRRGGLTGALAEDEDVAERVAAQAVGAVQPAAHLAGGVEPGHRRRGGVRRHPHSAHRVVDRRPDLEGLLGDVDRREGVELLVHRGKPLLDVLGAPVADVEEGAAVG